MTFARALLMVVLCAGTEARLLEAAGAVHGPGSERQQQTSGLVIAADIEGRLAIYDAGDRLVVELDKPGGRQLLVALEPGTYEATLRGQGSRRIRFEIEEGRQWLVAMASFAERDGYPPPAPGHSPGHTQHPRDGRHRIEVRFGGWASGSYDGPDEMWDGSGSVHGAFGLEYLHLVAPDVAVGIGLTGLVRAVDTRQGWDGGGAAQATCGIPIVARWYPVRRLTRVRSVEPFVTAGFGPVFGVDSFYDDGHDPWDWDQGGFESTRVGTTVGGRVGGGVDFRLGSVFTIGVGGAWNWDAFPDRHWRDGRPGGGEFAVALGWMFGR